MKDSNTGYETAAKKAPAADLGPEFRSLGDAAGDNCRDACGKTEEKSNEPDRIPVSRQQFFRRLQEGNAIGEGKADQEIGDRGNRPVGKNLD